MCRDHFDLWAKEADNQSSWLLSEASTLNKQITMFREIEHSGTFGLGYVFPSAKRLW